MYYRIQTATILELERGLDSFQSANASALNFIQARATQA